MRVDQLAAASSDAQSQYGAHSECASDSMIFSIVPAQPPQPRPARHAIETSLRELAPSRTASRIARSVTRLQWQTIMEWLPALAKVQSVHK